MMPPVHVTNSDEGELLLRVSGLIVAADFNPFVVRMARRLGVRGWIRCEGGGAVVRAIGDESSLALLVRAFWNESPASARIRSLDPLPLDAELPAVGESFLPLVEEAAPALARVA